MFSGSFSNTLDDKGRVAIPAKFRETLAPSGDVSLMVTIFEVANVPCLEAYSSRGWQEFIVELQSRIGQFAQNRLLFESAYIGSAQACQPDKQGRVLLPQSLRKFAELETDVVFAGVGKKFRIFSATGYAKVLDQYRSMLRENPNLFHDLGI
ncbi:MAG TPA: division/cell wall cluster transcriptional repressor MraZ [Candidatus Binatia bacterium]|nr:division/cell wall cluster transcriptional repressor MraZ [Candidatus Binatia bacterium]